MEKPRWCMSLSPNFWPFFAALKKGFSQIHHPREGLSTVWWENSPCTRFLEVSSEGDIGWWTNEPKESLESIHHRKNLDRIMVSKGSPARRCGCDGRSCFYS